MLNINGKNYFEHGDVIEANVHIGGEYNEDSILVGGRSVTKQGILRVKNKYNPDGDVMFTSSFGHDCHMPAWIEFFDGGFQSMGTLADKKGFPVKSATFIRPGTEQEISEFLK